jgi:hypothetical protein
LPTPPVPAQSSSPGSWPASVTAGGYEAQGGGCRSQP